MWHKQGCTQSLVLTVYQKPFLQRRKHRTHGLHLLLVTHARAPENLTFHTTASCRLRLHHHPADHIRGRCQGGEPFLTLLPNPQCPGS